MQCFSRVEEHRATGEDIDKGHILRAVLDRERMDWPKCSNLLRK